MRFMAGMIVGTLLAFSGFYLESAREKILDIWDLYQGQTAGTRLEISEASRSGELHHQFRRLPVPTAMNSSTSQADNIFPGPDEQIALRNFSPESERNTSQVAEGFSLRAAEGSLLRAAEGSLLRAAEGSFQPVWIPFRSEVSAVGFAAKLHQQVPFDFQVIKMGAGKYEVGFQYHSEAKRGEILDLIAGITGFDLRTGTDALPEVPKAMVQR